MYMLNFGLRLVPHQAATPFLFVACVHQTDMFLQVAQLALLHDAACRRSLLASKFVPGFDSILS